MTGPPRGGGRAARDDPAPLSRLGGGEHAPLRLRARPPRPPRRRPGAAGPHGRGGGLRGGPAGGGRHRRGLGRRVATPLLHRGHRGDHARLRARDARRALVAYRGRAHASATARPPRRGGALPGRPHQARHQGRAAVALPAGPADVGPRRARGRRTAHARRSCGRWCRCCGPSCWRCARPASRWPSSTTRISACWWTRRCAPASPIPDAEAALCVDLLNEIVAGVDGIVTAVHLCRRNKARQGWVGEGGYDPILPFLRRLMVRQYVLEFTIPVAGDFAVLRQLPDDRQIGLGCVDCRSAHVDTPEAIADRVGPGPAARRRRAPVAQSGLRLRPRQRGRHPDRRGLRQAPQRGRGRRPPPPLLRASDHFPLSAQGRGHGEGTATSSPAPLPDRTAATRAGSAGPLPPARAAHARARPRAATGARARRTR